MLVAAGGDAQVGEPYLVKDINVDDHLNLHIFQTGAFGRDGVSRVFVLFDDGIHGHELWIVDHDGARLVKDICPGACPGSPTPYGLPPLLEDEDLFFTADDGVHGRELWRTAGTEVTTEMVADIWPGPGSGINSAYAPVRGSVLYFVGVDPEHGEELWALDNTDASPHLVSDIVPGGGSSAPLLFAADQNRIWFTASTPESGRELYVSDGTSGGTRLVADLAPGAPSGLNNMVPSNVTRWIPGYALLPSGVFLFRGPQGLWRSDGSAAGTYQILDLHFNGVVVTQDVAVIATWSFGESGLWISDGTVEGTAILEAAEGAQPEAVTNLVAHGDRVFFAADDDQHGREMWISDLTSEGTSRIIDLHPGPTGGAAQTDLAELGNGIVFAGDDGATGLEPWFTDGTQAGTFQLADIVSGPADSLLDPTGRQFIPTDMTTTGEHVVFFAYDADGFGLWRTDGSGVQRLLDNSQTSAFFGTFANVAPYTLTRAVGGHRLFFATPSPFHDDAAPWVTDGTADGTKALTENHSEAVFNAFGFLQAGSNVYFTATTEAAGGELWVTDGSAPGTSLVADLDPSSQNSNLQSFPWLALDGALLFRGPGGLWRTEGSGATTEQIATIDPGTGAQLGEMIVFGGGDELFQTDGSAAGTFSYFAGVELVERFGPFFERRLTEHQGRLYFAGRDASHGAELWATDGTAAETLRLTDLQPGPADSIDFDSQPTSAAGHLFFVADDGVHGVELWMTDGETSSLVADIRKGAVGSYPRDLVAGPDALYFSADDGKKGRELWRSDGTKPGTKLVAQLVPGDGSSRPAELHWIDDAGLVFSAWSEAAGRELWLLPEAGPQQPQLIADIAPGAESSSPVALEPADGLLYFVANDLEHGFELWALPIPSPTLFRDGFESGDVAAWSSAVP